MREANGSPGADFSCVLERLYHAGKSAAALRYRGSDAYVGDRRTVSRTESSMRIDRFIICVAMLGMAASSAANADSPPAFTQDKARSIIANLQKVVSPNGIDQQMMVEIGG